MYFLSIFPNIPVKFQDGKKIGYREKKYRAEPNVSTRTGTWLTTVAKLQQPDTFTPMRWHNAWEESAQLTQETKLSQVWI